MRSAVLLVVGDELLGGRCRDENGSWLAARLAALGVRVVGILTVGDRVEALASTLREAAGVADLVLVSGGLGPTVDDVTREALARAADRVLVEDAGAWRAVTANLASRGRAPGEQERCQALVPEGGRWLPNTIGIAPGLFCPVGRAEVYAFPGVTRELRAMFEQSLSWRLEADSDSDQVEEGAVWVAGVPESEIAVRLAGAPALATVQTAFYPHDGEVELRFQAGGDGAGARVGHALIEAHGRLGDDAFTPPVGGRIEHAVVAALAERGLTLTTAESITGGLIARMVTRVPGASAVFPAGWVTYATAQKTALLGVPEALIAQHGVVSAPVAASMAEGARERAGADFAVATTGTAGPDPLIEPGHPPVEPGRVFIAFAGRDGDTKVSAVDLPFTRELVQRRAAVHALDRVRRALL